MKYQTSLQIIGGNWRSRKVSFANRLEIRPTGNRIRETLFNWLSSHISGANCLDLFAGSGILGIEALSRGASNLTFVENNIETAVELKNSLTLLRADRFKIFTMEANAYLKTTDQIFDIIFLDPPFRRTLLQDAIKIIAERKLSRNFVYVESDTVSNFESLPESWSVYRQKKAGNVHYGLITMP